LGHRRLDFVRRYSVSARRNEGQVHNLRPNGWTIREV
jgi:hypothetical protein